MSQGSLDTQEVEAPRDPWHWESTWVNSGPFVLPVKQALCYAPDPLVPWGPQVGTARMVGNCLLAGTERRCGLVLKM